MSLLSSHFTRPRAGGAGSSVGLPGHCPLWSSRWGSGEVGKASVLEQPGWHLEGSSRPCQLVFHWGLPFLPGKMPNSSLWPVGFSMGAPMPAPLPLTAATLGGFLQLSNRSVSFQPRGLCTCYFFCLEFPSPLCLAKSLCPSSCNNTLLWYNKSNSDPPKDTFKS